MENGGEKKKKVMFIYMRYRILFALFFSFVECTQYHYQIIIVIWLLLHILYGITKFNFAAYILFIYLCQSFYCIHLLSLIFSWLYYYIKIQQTVRIYYLFHQNKLILLQILKTYFFLLLFCHCLLVWNLIKILNRHHAVLVKLLSIIII